MPSLCFTIMAMVWNKIIQHCFSKIVDKSFGHFNKIYSDRKKFSKYKENFECVKLNKSLKVLLLSIAILGRKIRKYVCVNKAGSECQNERDKIRTTKYSLKDLNEPMLDTGSNLSEIQFEKTKPSFLLQNASSLGSVYFQVLTSWPLGRVAGRPQIKCWST